MGATEDLQANLSPIQSDVTKYHLDEVKNRSYGISLLLNKLILKYHMDEQSTQKPPWVQH